MPSAGDAVALVRRRFGDLPPRERVEAYRQMMALSTGGGRFDVEVPGDGFDFSATAFAMPGLTVSHVEFGRGPRPPDPRNGGGPEP